MTDIPGIQYHWEKQKNPTGNIKLRLWEWLSNVTLYKVSY